MYNNKDKNTMKNKLILITYLCTVMVTTPVHCMLSVWKFKPQLSRKNSKLNKTRMLFDKLLIDKSPVLIVRKVKKREAHPDYRCFQHALAQTTGLYSIKITRGFYLKPTLYSGDNFSTNITIENYFEQTISPKKNDLVIYTTDQHNRTINHCAIVYDNHTVESKWGEYPYILRHGLFETCTFYEKAAGFFTLKKEYATKKGKQLLRQTMKKELLAKEVMKFYAVIIMEVLLNRYANEFNTENEYENSNQLTNMTYDV